MSPLSAALVLGLGATPPAQADTPQWIQDLAPRVWFHQNEGWWPLSGFTFINHSELTWAHDAGCNDHNHASRGSVSAALMGSGGYSDRQKDGWCVDKGDVYDSNDDAAVWDAGGPGDDAEGFFLQLDNAWRDGDGLNNDEPVYVRRVPGEWLQFWFHYGNSVPASLQGYAHEGDWEHISIRLNASNVPQEVEYHYHHSACTLSWSNAPKYNGRPVIWVAKGAHGSYPANADPPWYDTISGDVLWTTGGNVDLMEDVSWYPYGGAWGEVGTSDDTTGPQGPHPSRGAPGFNSGTCDMN